MRHEAFGSGTPSALAETASTKSILLTRMRRRDVFRAAAAAGVVATRAFDGVASERTGGANKRKARYQASAPEVQNFYRVNRYPVR
jgi:hypothetical protein